MLPLLCHRRSKREPLQGFFFVLSFAKIQDRSEKGTTDLGFGFFVTRIVWTMMRASPNEQLRFGGTTA